MSVIDLVVPSPGRTHRMAATSRREAAEFVPYPAHRAARLERALRRGVAGEVRFSAGDRALYATDGSNYRQVPIGVVIPRGLEDVVQTVAICRGHGARYCRAAAAPASPGSAATPPSLSTIPNT